MAVVDLVMPKLGESIMEATILKWHKKSGDPVQMDETVLEIATDKVDSEVPSTAQGVIEETFYEVNDVVPIGTVIARIKTEEQASASPSQVGAPDMPYKMHEPASYTEAEHSEVASTVTNTSNRPVLNGNRFYSPLVLNIAASEGVSMSELEKIRGTGNEGRVTKKDILQYLSDKKAGRTKVDTSQFAIAGEKREAVGHQQAHAERESQEQKDVQTANRELPTF